MTTIINRVLGKLFRPKPTKPAKKAPVRKKVKKRVTVKTHPRLKEVEYDFSIHIAPEALADLLAYYALGSGREVAGQMVVDEETQMLIALNHVSTGSAGMVTRDPFDKLDKLAELEERAGAPVNGSWHTHSHTAFFSSTDDNDHLEQIFDVADTSPFGGVYYELVFGGAPDSIIRRFWWSNRKLTGDNTIYYADSALTVGRDMVPMRYHRTYYRSPATVVYAGIDDASKKEKHLTDYQYRVMCRQITKDKKWNLVSDLFNQHHQAMTNFAVANHISSVWKATAMFVFELGEDAENWEEYVELFSVDQFDLIQPELDIPLYDPEKEDDWLSQYMRQEGGDDIWFG